MAARCGTPSGYGRHYREGSKPCPACLAAFNAYRAQWRATRRLLGMSVP